MLNPLLFTSVQVIGISKRANICKISIHGSEANTEKDWVRGMATSNRFTETVLETMGRRDTVSMTLVRLWLADGLVQRRGVRDKQLS